MKPTKKATREEYFVFKQPEYKILTTLIKFRFEADKVVNDLKANFQHDTIRFVIGTAKIIGTKDVFEIMYTKPELSKFSNPEILKPNANKK